MLSFFQGVFNANRTSATNSASATSDKPVPPASQSSTTATPDDIIVINKKITELKKHLKSLLYIVEKKTQHKITFQPPGIELTYQPVFFDLPNYVVSTPTETLGCDLAACTYFLRTNEKLIETILSLIFKAKSSSLPDPDTVQCFDLDLLLPDGCIQEEVQRQEIEEDTDPMRYNYTLGY